MANLYLNDLDHAVNEKCEQKPTMVRYADDLLILCKPGQGPGLQTRLKRWLEARKLKLNEEKTRLVDTRKEGIEFLGFSVAWRQGLKSKRWYPHVEPSAKSQAKLRDKVREVLEVRTRNQAAVAVVRKVNQITRGWAGAFHYGNSSRVFGRQQLFVRNRLRRWLWRKYGCTHGLFEFFTDDRLEGQYKLEPPRKAKNTFSETRFRLSFGLFCCINYLLKTINKRNVGSGKSFNTSSATPGGSTCEFFFTPVRSDFSAFLNDIMSFWWRHPVIQVAVDQDLENAALKDKCLRQEDRAFELARSAALPLDAHAEAHNPFNSSLLTGRPRTPAVVVFIAALVTGFTGSAYGAASRTLLLESVSLQALLGDLGHKLPADNTLGTLVNRISQSTLDLIHRAQLADFIKEGLDTFDELTVDSTAIKASSCWPTDAKLIYRHFERSCRLGAKLSNFGLTPLNVVCKDVLLKELKNHERSISLLGGGPHRARRLRHLYDKFYESACRLANKLLDAASILLQNVDKELLTIKPSHREQAIFIIRLIQQDSVSAITTIQQSMQRVHDGVSTKARDKVLSLADRSAALIEKGGREPVLGYKPQLARSASGFVTALLLDAGNAADCLSLVPLVEQSIFNTGVTPSKVGADDGYAGKKFLEALRALGVEQLSISGSKGKAQLGEDLWNHPDYMEQRCNRSAVESLMFTLKFNHNFGHPGRRGVTAVRAELTLKVLAYNFDHAVLIRARRQSAEPLSMAA